MKKRASRSSVKVFPSFKAKKEKQRFLVLLCLLACSAAVLGVARYRLGASIAGNTTVHINAAWLANPANSLHNDGTFPYILGSNTNYILDQNVDSPVSAFVVNDNQTSTFDLNGHTITYADFPYTEVQNPGFETASGTLSPRIPDGWDLSHAPLAFRQNYAEQMSPFGVHSLNVEAFPTIGAGIVGVGTNDLANSQSLLSMDVTKTNSTGSSAGTVNLNENYANAFQHAYTDSGGSLDQHTHTPSIPEHGSTSSPSATSIPIQLPIPGPPCVCTSMA